jgi:hypothetical protein
VRHAIATIHQFQLTRVLRQDLQNASAQLSPTMRRASDMILRDL